MSQTTNQNSDLTLSPEQVENVYKGLKQGEEYKRRFEECYEVSISMGQVIEQNVQDLEHAVTLIDSLNLQIASKHAELVNKEVEIAKIQVKKQQWYKSPWLWLGVGFFGGVLIAK